MVLAPTSGCGAATLIIFDTGGSIKVSATESRLPQTCFSNFLFILVSPVLLFLAALWERRACEMFVTDCGCGISSNVFSQNRRNISCQSHLETSIVHRALAHLDRNSMTKPQRRKPSRHGCYLSCPCSVRLPCKSKHSNVILDAAIPIRCNHWVTKQTHHYRITQLKNKVT